MDFSVTTALGLAGHGLQSGLGSKETAAQNFAAGCVCIARANAAIFADATSWDRVGRLERGQRVVASGPPVTVDFYKMVPIEPEGAVDAGVLEPLGVCVDRPQIVGSWDEWSVPQAMAWDDSLQCFTHSLCLGKRGIESFQIICDGDWKRCLHPDSQDACPHEEHAVCGPDEEGHGKDWTIGWHPKDRALPGSVFTVRLFLRADRSAERVDWVRCDELAATGLEPGLLARVHGLEVAPELNGEECSCERWDSERGRWAVRFRNGESQALKPENLEEAFNGLWGSTEGEEVISSIVQVGRQVLVTSGACALSPASGEVSEDAIILEAASEAAPSRTGRLADGMITWDDSVVWYRLEEGAIADQEGAIADQVVGAAEQPPGFGVEVDEVEEEEERAQAPQLWPGAPVRLCGLLGHPEMNGLEGVCQEWDQARRRWAVRLAVGETKLLKPENLEELPARKEEKASPPAAPSPSASLLGQRGAFSSFTAAAKAPPSAAFPGGQAEEEDEGRAAVEGRHEGSGRRGTGLAAPLQAAAQASSADVSRRGAAAGAKRPVKRSPLDAS